MSKHHLDKRAADLIAAGAGDPDDLLNTKQVAAWLGNSPITLEIWRSKGKGPPFIRLSPRMIKYRRGDVLAWLISRRCASTAKYRNRAWHTPNLNEQCAACPPQAE